MEQYNQIIHDPLRLRIMVALARVERMDFVELKLTTDATDGNLAAHLRTLEDTKYISTEKTFVDRRPRTYYRLTLTGATALSTHLNYLEKIIELTD